MYKYICLLVIISAFQMIHGKIPVDQLKCLVCKNSLAELVTAVRNIDPTKTVDIGGFRLDSKGNYQHKTVSQSKSEIHLSELIEEVCEKMDNYARATWKSNGTLTLMKLVNDKGAMNPDASNVDFVQDEDLNKSLKFSCEEIMEEYEDSIIKHIQNEVQNIPESICYKEAQLCVQIEHKEEL